MNGRGSFDISVVVHREDGTLWAESPDWPGWTAAADSWNALAERVRESVDVWRPGTSWYMYDGEMLPPAAPTSPGEGQ
jgi:predicted RNase H-like HicB family nuclease